MQSRNSQMPNEGASGVQIDGYELLGRIGRGPRAEVWRARPRGGTEVALKVFFPHLTRAANFVSRFEKETSALTALTHPNILPAHDRGRSNGYYFLTSDWMMRGSLREAMLAGPVPAERAVQIGLGVCEALDYGARRGLPHRHLVPENIFIDVTNRVRVSDFGLTLLSGAGFVDGDSRSDLHALGAILYELVTGVVPGMDAPPASRHAPNIPARLDEVLARALAPRPSDRYGRATELALALRLVTAAKSNGALPHPSRDAIQIGVKGRLITITILPEATQTDVEACIARLDSLLGQQSRWRIAYDLAHLNVMDDGVRQSLQKLHVRHQNHLERVAFCSPRALVRSSALVLGGSVKRVPWKSFAASGPMHAWLDEASP